MTPDQEDQLKLQLKEVLLKLGYTQLLTKLNHICIDISAEGNYGDPVLASLWRRRGRQLKEFIETEESNATD